MNEPDLEEIANSLERFLATSLRDYEVDRFWNSRVSHFPEKRITCMSMTWSFREAIARIDPYRPGLAESIVEKAIKHGHQFDALFKSCRQILVRV